LASSCDGFTDFRRLPSWRCACNENPNAFDHGLVIIFPGKAFAKNSEKQAQKNRIGEDAVFLKKCLETD
jgi:hypothetical protein